ncbi:MAG: hypothetical protein ACSLFK_00745 [Gemmatimonadaceae bacterium]
MPGACDLGRWRVGVIVFSPTRSDGSLIGDALGGVIGRTAFSRLALRTW